MPTLTKGPAGLAGTPGSVWRDGTGVPSDALGVDGDYYLDHATSRAYHRASGHYVYVASLQGVQGIQGLQGPQGIQGPQGPPWSGGSGAGGATIWRDGDGAPPSILGGDGDYYLDLQTADVYVRVSGAYSLALNLRGAAGATGPAGAQGTSGVASASSPLAYNAGTHALSLAAPIPETLGGLGVSTPITGLVKGSGGAYGAAVAGTDFQAPVTVASTSTAGLMAASDRSFLDAATASWLNLVNATGYTFPATLGTSNGTPGAVINKGPFNWTGWGSASPARAAFTALQVTLNAWSAAGPVTTARCRVRDSGPTGTVLADISMAAPLALGVDTDVLFEFGSVINNGSNPLWIEVFTDGLVGIRQTSSVLLSSPLSQLWTNGTAGAQFLVTPGTGNNVGTQFNIWARFASVGAQGVVETAGPPGGYPSLAGFYSWGAPIGVHQGFNFADVWIKPSHPAIPVTRCRYRICTTDKNGAVLVDQTFALTTAYNTPQRVKAFFPRVVNAGASPLWLEVHCDGPWYYREAAFNNVASYPPSAGNLAFPTTSGFPQMQAANSAVITTSGENTVPSLFGVTNDNLYCKLGLGDLSLLALASGNDVASRLRVLGRPSPPVLLLPPMIYGVQGKEVSVYFESLLWSNFPLSQYQFDVVCKNGAAGYIGGQFDSRWVATPVSADVGDNTWTLNVYYDGALVASGSTTLRVRAPSASPSITRKLLIIGDSTSIDGRPLAELLNLCTGSGLTITPIGTKTATVADAGTDGKGAGATTRTVNLEAISGKGINYFFSDPASPFVFSGNFNFATYLATNSLTLASGDWVFIDQGINDVLGADDTGTSTSQIATLKANLDTIVGQIKAAIPGVRIAHNFLAPPETNQDAWGFVDFTGQTRWRAKNNLMTFNQMILNAYGAATASNQWIMPLGTGIDMANNVPLVASAFNYYNATTYLQQQNQVHPGGSGYYQKGANYYHFLRGQES